jgi:hypothetical protein
VTVRRTDVVIITCPWCEADEPVDPTLLEAAGAEFVCPECRTCVRLVDTGQDGLDLAA